MKKAMKFGIPVLTLACASLLIYLSCGKDKTTTPAGPSTEWTIMVYSDGNNNLDNAQGGGSYCIQDIQDLETVGSTNQVQIVAMVASMRTGGAAKYYHIEHYPDDLGDNISSTVLANKGSKDMSDWHTLKDFLVFGFDTYPAKRYMLIVDDHGAGWPGSCVDDQNGSGNIMSMFDMATAIEQASSEKGVAKFEVVTFHACLMSMVEVGYELRNAANYLVASEFSMPMESVLGADIWLAYLVAHPTIGARELSTNIVDAVYQTGIAKQKTVHMAATDLSKMNRLAARMDNFGTQLLTSTGDYWYEVLDAWLHTNTTQYDHPAYVDVRELANKIKQEPNLQNINLIRAAADSVINALNDAVAMTATNAQGITRGGLTIHMPYLRAYYDSTNYARIDFRAVPWTNFLSQFIGIIEAIIGNSLSVSIDPPGGGTVAVDPDRPSYNQGDVVTLTASPNANYNFVNWTVQGNTVNGNPIQITFANSDISVTAHFTQGGGNQATVSGTVTWPGHTLSSHTYAFADSVHSSNLYLVSQVSVNPANGTYTLTITNMPGPLSLVFEAQDDVNNSGPWDPIDAGDGWGFFDYNGDQIWNDYISVSPGQNLTGANIVLQTVSLGKENPRRFNSR